MGNPIITDTVNVGARINHAFLLPVVVTKYKISVVVLTNTRNGDGFDRDIRSNG
jgi:hypothetical protein